MSRRRLLVVLCALVWIGVMSPEPAYAELGCFRSLDLCMRTTALYDWWDGFLAALDCELRFVACIRGEITGW